MGVVQPPLLVIVEDVVRLGDVLEFDLGLFPLFLGDFVRVRRERGFVVGLFDLDFGGAAGHAQGLVEIDFFIDFVTHYRWLVSAQSSEVEAAGDLTFERT